MKALSNIQGHWSWWLLMVTGLLLGGCATTPRIDWDSRIGAMNYDEVVRELGPPERETTLSDGARVAEWMTYRGRGHGSYDFYGPTYYRHHYHYPSMGHFHYYESPDYLIRLTFDPDGILRDYQRIIR
jgi:hypothetical protein